MHFFKDFSQNFKKRGKSAEVILFFFRKCLQANRTKHNPVQPLKCCFIPTHFHIWCLFFPHVIYICYRAEESTRWEECNEDTLITSLFLFCVICAWQTEPYSLVKYTGWPFVMRSETAHCEIIVLEPWVTRLYPLSSTVGWKSETESLKGEPTEKRRQEKTRRADWAQRVVGLFMMQQYLGNCRRSVKGERGEEILGFRWEIYKWEGGATALEGWNSWGWGKKAETVRAKKQKEREFWRLHTSSLPA